MWERAVPLRDQVRVPLRMAVVLCTAGRGPGPIPHRRLAGPGTHRGAVRAVRLPPRSPLRRRGIRDTHRHALLHQRHRAEPGDSGMTDTPEKVVYTARATAVSGREGRATSDDGILDLAARWAWPPARKASTPATHRSP